MLFFLNDYGDGAHPKVLDALVKTNYEYTLGYGEDKYCIKAKKIIREKLNCKNADIHFLVGGTQTNLITISHILKPYEAVIACNTGHISVHETGAIEATGHKIIEVPGKDFKVTVEDIKTELKKHESFHMVKPKLVFISNTTELGGIYTKKELEKLSKVCRENDLYLFLDGARISSAIACEKSDLELKDYAKYCDAMYFGGTKSGLLFGEAVILINDKIKENFKFYTKQRGGLLAKGRLLGIQFIELFKNNLYLKIGEHSNKMAMKMKKALVEKGIELVSDTYTNQIFVYLNDEKIKKLSKKVLFTVDFCPNRDEKIVRFVTSWGTKEEEVDKFIEIIKKM
ncbi:threonine aldolase family protein [Oceanivirga salmonicida]|uniref:threonine aldolase family protein n=1 Tax=Oceanivirga salmonicida TaxID=1769291 RepID=UPI000834CD98|nr:low specificity L-threonine aldolase [Oceanivirga salmonicida]